MTRPHLTHGSITKNESNVHNISGTPTFRQRSAKTCEIYRGYTLEVPFFNRLADLAECSNDTLAPIPHFSLVCLIVLCVILTTPSQLGAETYLTPDREAQPERAATVNIDGILPWWKGQAINWHFVVIASTGYAGHEDAFIAPSADRVERALESRYGSDERQRIAIQASKTRPASFKASPPNYLVATPDDVLYELNTLSHFHQEDRVILYYVGHGDPESNELLLPMKDLPLSASWQVTRLLNAAKAQDSRDEHKQFAPYQLIVVLDTCFSGRAIGEDAEKYRTNGVSYLTSTELNGLSYRFDKPPDDLELQRVSADELPSAFSYYVARAFTQDWREAASDDDLGKSYDGILTLQRLNNYISRHLGDAYDQHLMKDRMNPQTLLSSTPSENGGLIRAANDPVIYYSPDEIASANYKSRMRKLLEDSLVPITSGGECEGSLQRQISIEFRSETATTQPLSTTARLICAGTSWTELAVNRPPPGFKTKSVLVTLFGPDDTAELTRQRWSPNQEQTTCQEEFKGTSTAGLPLTICLRQ